MRKRGAHFKRRIDPRAGLHAIAMQHGLDDAQQADLGVALRVNLEALRTGQADEAAFHTLAAAVNVSLVLCERGVGADHLPAIKRAQEGMLRLWTRAKQTGRWVFDGGGWHDTAHAIDLHEAQLAAVSRKAASEAMREVMRRINSGNIFEEQRA